MAFTAEELLEAAQAQERATILDLTPEPAEAQTLLRKAVGVKDFAVRNRIEYKGAARYAIGAPHFASLTIRRVRPGRFEAELFGYPSAWALWKGAGATPQAAIMALKPANKQAAQKPGPRQEKVAGMLLTNPERIGEGDWRKIVSAAKTAAALVKQAGLGHALRGARLEISANTDEDGHRADYQGGLYGLGVTVDLGKPFGPSLVAAFIEAIGYRYLNTLPSGTQIRWEIEHNKAKKAARSAKDEFAAKEGARWSHADFGTLFTAFVGRPKRILPRGGHYPRKGIARLVKFLKSADRRAKLREGEEIGLTPLSEWTL